MSACAASRPDITADSTQPVLSPLAVQSPATVRLSTPGLKGESRNRLLPGTERA